MSGASDQSCRGQSSATTRPSLMRIGPRYLHKSLSFPDPSAEKDALSTSLEGAPGMVSVHGVEPHHKGGHRASLEVDQVLLNDFITHMDAQGWMDGL
jgi:hypothetical protein